MQQMSKWLAALLLGALAGAASAQDTTRLPNKRTELVDGPLKLTLVDMSPRFLDFYNAAQGADPDARWKLWDQKYGFAAVPPTPQGQAMARKMLDGAWDKYASALPVIEAGATAMRPEPMLVLKELTGLFGLEQPFAMEVRTYVGAFDSNAFTSSSKGVPFVAIPLEMGADERALMLRHEMAHAVHLATAGLSGGWERSIAETIVQEGLAMHAVKALLPGREDRVYVEHRPGWYAQALPKVPKILQALDPVLETKDAETVFRFTMGEGSTGTEREAYLAGWVVVGELLRQGRTFPEIARIRAEQMPAVVREAIASANRRAAQ